MKVSHPIALIAVSLVCLPSEAAMYKCSAVYASGTKLTLHLSVPDEGQAKLVTLLGPRTEPTNIGKGTGFVSEGTIEYNRLGSSPLDRSTLVITNAEPLLAFFQDPHRVVSVRIDGKPPNAKITYYDAWFAPTEVAFGSCS